MGRTGCLFWILILVAISYFGVEVGTIYLRAWRMEDEMKTQAAFAPSLTDETIRRRLLLKIEELQLPEEARRITIRRTARPREILIATSYDQTLELPFYSRIIRFNLEVRQGL